VADERPAGRAAACGPGASGSGPGLGTFAAAVGRVRGARARAAGRAGPSLGITSAKSLRSAGGGGGVKGIQTLSLTRTTGRISPLAAPLLSSPPGGNAASLQLRGGGSDLPGAARKRAVAFASVGREWLVRAPDTDPTLEGAPAAMLTLTAVYSAHRFIAGPFGVLLLAFPSSLNNAMAMGRALPTEERFCLQACMYRFVTMHARIHVHMQMHMHMHIHVHVHEHVHTHTHIHTHVHICICIRVYVCLHQDVNALGKFLYCPRICMYLSVCGGGMFLHCRRTYHAHVLVYV